MFRIIIYDGSEDSITYFDRLRTYKTWSGESITRVITDSHIFRRYHIKEDAEHDIEEIIKYYGNPNFLLEIEEIT